MSSSELKPELQQVLHHVLTNNGLELRSYTVTQGCRPGDNYIGEVLRVTVIATELKSQSDQFQEYKYIFKCPPSSAAWRKTIESIKFSRNEINFYQHVLPELETFRMKFGNDKILPMSIPKFYYGSCNDKESDVLVLEDLKISNYSLVNDKTKGLDFDHCKLVLKELGRFHALSLAFKILQADDFNKIKAGIKEVMFCDEYRETFATIHVPCEAALNMVKTRFSDTQLSDVIDKTANLIHEFYDKMIKLVQCETSLLSVINHGDCWTNNFMFQYRQNGIPNTLKLLDFQVVRCGSIALDISYFLFNCTDQHTRDLYWDSFLDMYLIELNNTLKEYNIEESHLVTRDQLDAELASFGTFGIGMAILIIPLLTSASTEQPSLDNCKESFDNLHNNQHKNDACFSRLTDIICDAAKRGILV